MGWIYLFHRFGSEGVAGFGGGYRTTFVYYHFVYYEDRISKNLFSLAGYGGWDFHACQQTEIVKIGISHTVLYGAKLRGNYTGRY